MRSTGILQIADLAPMYRQTLMTNPIFGGTTPEAILQTLLQTKTPCSYEMLAREKAGDTAIWVLLDIATNEKRKLTVTRHCVERVGYPHSLQGIRLKSLVEKMFGTIRGKGRVKNEWAKAIWDKAGYLSSSLPFHFSVCAFLLSLCFLFLIWIIVAALLL